MVKDNPKIIGDFPALVGFLSQQFGGIGKRFKSLNDRMNRRFNLIELQLMDKANETDLQPLATNAKADQLMTAVANLAHQVKTNNQEVKAISQRQSTVEEWVRGAASKIGLEYRP